ncbi:hypothetical protein GGF43_004594 [Coemansia sp. RSA 2618]|nr:hypothetical protein GGF43_004594 [Coemansia sp. RSA 2618]
MWLAALNEAIVNSVVYVKRRQAKHAAAGKLPVQQTQDIDNSTNKSVSDESSGPNSAHVSPILNVATIAAVAAAAAAATSPPPPSSSSKPTNSRSFWSSKPFALTKSSMTEKHFKGFTSPEILRLHAVEALKHEKLPETFLSLASRVPSPPRIPFLATSQPPDTSPDNEAHTNNRPSNGSYPSHITAVDADQYTEADTDSDEYGAFSISSTCHEPIRQPALKYNHFVEDNAQRRSFDDIQDIISEIGGAPTAGSKDSFSERLFGALGHFHTAKRRTAATHIGMFGDGRTDAGACHERSFSVGAYGRKC